jgi:ketosteroid isomerase-like protein
MNKPILSLVMVVLLGSCVVGCQTTRQDVATEACPEEQASIAKLLDQIYACVQTKDIARLAAHHLYGPKFTDFKNGEPRGDAEANRKAERESVSTVSDFKYALNDLKVNVFGDAAVATFHGEFSGKKGETPFATKLQGTIVFVKSGGEWKIAHEHFSPLKM